MSGLENVFRDNDEFWQYVKENPRMVGIPVSENKGLDLLGALRILERLTKKIQR